MPVTLTKRNFIMMGRRFLFRSFICVYHHLLAANLITQANIIRAYNGQIMMKTKNREGAELIIKLPGHKHQQYKIISTHPV